MKESDLSIGRNYTWEELGSAFNFRPEYLGSAGGMVSRPETNSLLLITHPNGGKSFDYSDYWEGADLIYTGRGQTGDQKLQGPNLYVAENTHKLYLFEATGVSKVLKFLGHPTCVDFNWATGLDSNKDERKVIRFRLRLPVNEETSSPIVESVGRAKFFGGGESKAHKDLKEFVAANPNSIGLPSGAIADIEHSFKSPDRADIVFSLPNQAGWVAVEIELSGAENTLVGAWQAIKYRTLLSLEHKLDIPNSKCKCILVANTIPQSTRDFCNRYGVSFCEIRLPT